MKFVTRATLILVLLPLLLFARNESHPFENSDQEALYIQLKQELRCLFCQNQNLADSNADLTKVKSGLPIPLAVSGDLESELVTVVNTGSKTIELVISKRKS